MELTDNSSCRLLLIGGFPKGHNIPFHPSTLSGKRLRKIVEKKNGLNVKYYDLWNNEREEQDGQISYAKANEIGSYQFAGWRVIALGKHVWSCLKRHSIRAEYLPHPASRHKSDLQKLEDGLVKQSGDSVE